MYKLVIVESPSKAKTIEKYLGSDFKVVSSKGHIRDLAISGKGGLGVDIENNFTPKYEISKDKKNIVKELKDLVNKAEFVYLATDPDREGEAIAWHLAQVLDLNENEDNRIIFHEVTKPAVKQAVENPHQIDMPMVDSQETRRILDRILGFKLSNLLYKKIKSRSAGRVQSVALKLIVEREEEVKAFKPEEYWDVFASFDKFDASLTKLNGEKLEKQLKNKEMAEKIKDECLKNSFEVIDIKQENKNKYPKAPYITSTLQQDASSKLYFTSKKTSSVAQKLYEGIDIGTGITGLITYMRTDSNRLSDVFLAQGYEYIKDAYTDKYVGSYTAKVDKNAQDAHEAIRPTNIQLVPELIKQYLSNDEYKLYRMIYYRTLACMMKPMTYTATNVALKNGNYQFEANGKTIIFDGYMKVYAEFEKDEDTTLPTLKISEKLDARNVESRQHFTEGPKRYTEASLIKAMDENGIGRPSTYATIVETIQKREYVLLEKTNEKSKTKVFIPTEQGVLTTKKLDEFFESIINVKYTAEMESDLDKIAEEKLDELAFLKRFYGDFEPLLEKADEQMEKIKPVELDEVCPMCGHTLVIRKGKFGEFVACSDYPNCKYSRNVNGSEEPEETGELCPECNAPLINKTGRFGKYVGCSKCKYIKKMPKPKPEETGELCPECGSPLVKRKSRYGTDFVGCSNYPKCHYIKKDESNPKTVKKK